MPPFRQGRRRRGLSRGPRERGSEAVEVALVLPALMLLLVAGVQFALYGLAEHAAEAAVAEGGAMARAADGGPAAARRLVLDDAAKLAGALLVSPRVSVSRRPGPRLDVALTAEVPSLIPGVHLGVRATSDGPLQVFRGGG